MLPNGKVLVAGGFGADGHNLSSAELYDPATGTWTTTGSLAAGRAEQTATLLPNGKVLVAGGALNGNELARAELYDPASGTWSATGKLATARSLHTATLLPDGKVLVAGGSYNASAELYDPANGTWTVTDSLANERGNSTATLLPDGNVLVAGSMFPSTATAELYDVGLGFSSAWQPVITVAKAGKSLQLTGSQFQGVSQASGGNTQDSSSNYPVVQLRNIDNSQVAFLLVDPVRGWSDTSFRSSPVRNFPPGPALVTVFTNGIPSSAKYLVVPSSH